MLVFKQSKTVALQCLNSGTMGGVQVAPDKLFGYSSECLWSATFVTELAVARRKQIGLSELFAGFFLGNHYQFVRAFRDTAKLSRFFIAECGLEEPVWFYWCRLYEKFKSGQVEPILIGYDAQSASFLELAASIATNQTVESSGLRLVTLESILLAADEKRELSACAKLMACGLMYVDVRSS